MDYDSYPSSYQSPYQSSYPSPYPKLEQNQLWQQYAVHRNRRDIIGHIERVATEYAKKIKNKVQFTLPD